MTLLSETELNAQINEMKPLTEALLGMSETLLERNGNFLPHGAILNMSGDVSYVGAASETEMTNSVEILPLLHDGLRSKAALVNTLAVGVSENVYIGENQQPAIKVLLEHRNGGCVAVYLPFKKRLLRGIGYGDIMMREAIGEVNGWAS